MSRWADSRQVSRIGVGVAAVVLAMAGPAFACTEILGKTKITALDNGASKTATWTGNGEDASTASKGYCHGLKRESWTSPGRVFDVTVGVERGSCAPALLPTGRYQVRWVKAPAAPDHNGVTADCNLTLPSTASRWVTLGVLNVGSSTSGTAGSTTISLVDGNSPTAPVMRGHGNICVTNGGQTAAPMAFVTWI